MFMMLSDKMMTYFTDHVMFNSVVHFVLGFSIALLLQHYYKKNSFLPVNVAWILLALALVAHLMPYFG